ncbi:AraC family transcriptional regulator [Parvibaculaceae bacterium PLY_AMNH_Bact1]|nr:AraC family transcriptional regulator [Parvibaculaceae bacterium PLY_AMNH_Bact1]
MMDLHLFLFAIDVVAFVTITLMGINFLVSQPRNLNARLLTLISFNTACYIIFTRYIYSNLIPAPYQVDPGGFLILLRFVMNLTPGLFMILAHSLFQDDKRFPRWLFAAFAVQVLLEEPIPVALSIDVALGDFLFETVPAVLQLIFTGLAMAWTIRNWRADMVGERRKLRILFLLVIGIIIIFSVLARILVPLGIITPLATYLSSSISYALLGVIGVLTALRDGTHFFTEPGQRTPSAPTVSKEDALSEQDVATIRDAFEKNHIYREGGLSIGSLAAKLAIPEYRLRKIIHRKLGYRNFNALVHHYRIEEAAERLISENERHLPILTVALSVGYQSINPFNRAFRELKDMSPSEYRTQYSPSNPG